MAEATDTVSTDKPAPGTGGALPGLDTDQGLLDDLVKSQKAKVSAESYVLGETVQHTRQDRDYMQRMLAREGASLDDVKPWDQKAERAKYRADPIESFGSFAGMFAMAASAFTKQPAVNALNAGAAAINAARERGDEEYNLAYQAWKDNSELAIKRGNMMHQQYSDALSLLNTDMTLGEVQMKALAAKFGDQQTLTLMEHGMWPQLFEMQAARAKAIEGMTKAVASSNEYSFRWSGFQNDARRHSQNPQEQMQAFNEWMGVTTPVDQAIMQKWWAEHPGATTDDAIEFIGRMNRLKYLGRGTDRQQFINQKVDELSQDPRTANLPTSEKMKLAENEWQAVNKKQTFGDIVQEHIKSDIRAEHPDWTPGQVDKAAIAQVAEARKSGLTGNKREQLASHIKQYEESIGTIDTEIGILRRYIGAAGAPGTVLRLKEKVGNLLGSNQTDRNQFESDLNYLRLTATRLLLDANGRPLSAEHDQVNKIVRGLNLGDTTANTIRALTDLKARYDRLMKANQQRLEQGGPVTSTTPPSAPTDTSGASAEPKWKQAPLVQ